MKRLVCLSRKRCVRVDVGKLYRKVPVMDNSPRTKMKLLLDLRQSVWLDYLHRELTRSGELGGLIDDGLRGMTSNPTIFEQAIGGSAIYDGDLAGAAFSSKTDREM